VLVGASAGSAGGGPPTASSTTPASCWTVVAGPLTSTGEPTESSTTSCVVSAAATSPTTELATNGAWPATDPAADAGSSEYASLTTGTRRRTVRVPCAPACGRTAERAAGTAGGACSFGTVSGGNHARATRSPGSGATYAGMRNALTIGFT
jgi:hypothetical protein